jgi:hypothetical protein
MHELRAQGSSSWSIQSAESAEDQDVNALWHRGIHGDDPPQWIDLTERTQVELCCSVMEGDDGWFHDSVVSMAVRPCLAALRRMDESPLGLEMRRAVLDTCRKEVERRMDEGEL